MPNKVLCVIPARSGSKRLPDKAILPFADVSLLEITCSQSVRLKKSGVFTDVVFSSDSQSYCDMAYGYRIDDLRLRPPELATDDAKSIDVVRDALEWMESEKCIKYDTVVLLQVTSPLRLDEDIELCLKNIERFGSVRSGTIRQFMEGGWHGLIPVKQINGAVYAWVRNNVPYHGDYVTIYMPPERSIDIDTEFDFKVAEFIYLNNLHKV